MSLLKVMMLIGYARVSTDDQKLNLLAVKLYNDRQYPISEICQMMGISIPTLYNYVAEGQPK
jgi:predicted site-specific integrase-resolvase